VVVSIDDFGTGFSSLARLSELPVGELKLDRTFASRLLGAENGERDLALIRSAIDLGHSLGMRVVAEGIERIELVELLARLHCDRGQGFAIRPPVPARHLDLGTFSPSIRMPSRREESSHR
jgi:EAL domain-containing protein (putative c-di-GMP-specific phosphodiesterase class I)